MRDCVIKLRTYIFVHDCHVYFWKFGCTDDVFIMTFLMLTAVFTFPSCNRNNATYMYLYGIN